MANGRCRMHGGKALSGLAHPAYKSGRYSKYLPRGIGKLYADALRDPHLFALKDDLALVDARIRQLLERLESRESGWLWKKLQEARESFIKHRESADQDGMRHDLDEMVFLIGRGSDDWAVWSELYEAIDRRVRVAREEWRRLVDMQQVMTSEQALMLLQTVVDTVQRHVTDREALRRISTELGKLVAGEPGRAFGPETIDADGSYVVGEPVGSGPCEGDAEPDAPLDGEGVGGHDE